MDTYCFLNNEYNKCRSTIISLFVFLLLSRTSENTSKTDICFLRNLKVRISWVSVE